MEKTAAFDASKVSLEQFVLAAIEKLRDLKYSKGINVSWSGLNDAIRAFYNTDPREAINKLAREKKIVLIPHKGQAPMIYKPEDKPGYDSERAAMSAKERAVATINKIMS